MACKGMYICMFGVYIYICMCVCMYGEEEMFAVLPRTHPNDMQGYGCMYVCMYVHVGIYTKSVAIPRGATSDVQG